MAKLTFEDLSFEEKDGKLIVTFLDNFWFEADKSLLEKDVRIRASGNEIEFADLDEISARNRLNAILDAGFLHLRNKITGKPSFYVNKYTGLSLIGNGAFGIVDRNSSLLEIKPITGCNMNCIFCSVDEGLTSRKTSEIVIDEEYLAQETKKVVEYKGVPVQITINAHGEPTTYRPMPKLISDLKHIENVAEVSLITNGTYLSEVYIDHLAEAKLDMLNVSLNAISPKAAKMLEGSGKYDVEHVKKMCMYAVLKMKVILAPVYVPGYNDEEIELIIKFAKEIGAQAGIQNFLEYKKGRNPKGVVQKPWEDFYKMLQNLEKKLDFKLILSEKDFHVVKTKPLPKPFKKGDIVKAEIICSGRYPGELIANSGSRNITITGYEGNKKSVKARITGDKHNLFYGKAV